MHYAYPCLLAAEDQGAFSVSFPDLPEAFTCGDDRPASLDMAEDALVVALCARMNNREPIPVPSPLLPGQNAIAVPPLLAAKLALHTAMQHQAITKVSLASRMGVSESVVRKLLDPTHRSHIDNVVAALRLVGRTLVIADAAIPASRTA